eukprot:scaffold223812_cov45-Attheya_sp.AAC.1
MSKGTHWYHEPDDDVFVMVKIKQVVMTDINMNAVTATNTLPRKWAGYIDKNPHCLDDDDQAIIWDKISGRENYNYTETVQDENYNTVDSESDDD